MTNEIETRESETEPWTAFDRAFDALRQSFVESFGVLPFSTRDDLDVWRAPRTDVTDTGKTYKILAEVPGIPKEKIDIRVRGPIVEIRGENASENEEKQKPYLRRERTYSGYYRALELPEPVVGAEAKAKVTDGVLELELPKQNPTPSADEVKVSVA